MLGNLNTQKTESPSTNWWHSDLWEHATKYKIKLNIPLENGNYLSKYNVTLQNYKDIGNCYIFTDLEFLHMFVIFLVKLITAAIIIIIIIIIRHKTLRII